METTLNKIVGWFSSAWNYIKSKWLFLIIIITLILANCWIWAKATPETKIIVKVDTNILLSFCLVLFTGGMFYYAMKQHQLNRTMLKLSAYDKRLAIYESMKKFLASVFSTGEVDDKELMQMMRETRHAQFLFDNKDKIVDYINEFWDKGNLWHLKSEYLKYPKNEENRLNLIEEQSQITKWFNDQYKIVDQKFEKYLKI